MKELLEGNGCRISKNLAIGELDCVVLENEKIYLKILNGKGADVIALIYKPLGIDLVWISNTGLPDKRFSAQDYQNEFLFTDSYLGGWQSIFPNGGLPSEFNGVKFLQHDEVSLHPWSYRILENSDERISVAFDISAQKVPFRLTKIFTLERNSALLQIEEQVENISDQLQYAMWGHHITFGQPFLTCNSKVVLTGSPTVIPHPTEIDSGGRRLGSSSNFDWPFGLDSEGKEIDFSEIPDRGTESDLLYLTDLDNGAFRIESPDVGLAIDYEWEKEIFPYLWYWQEFGHTEKYPWFGKNFNIGLEPFSSFPTNGIAEAYENGTVMKFAPNQTKVAKSTFEISELQTTKLGEEKK